LFLCRNAVEIDQIICASREETRKHTSVKIGARGRIDMDKLCPTEIAFVL
jgi:hypothetical protein